MINDQANGIRALKEKALLPKEPKRYTIPKISEKKKKQILEDSELAKQNAALEKWFNDKHRESAGICENCTNLTSKFNTKRWKWELAHIIPKEHFLSVKTHPYNILFLCDDCHSCYDSSWDAAKKMKVWDLAKKRFEFFEKSITETHKILDHFKFS
jgi:5-methylcytosine-specific restriction endonuclease McrA